MKRAPKPSPFHSSGLVRTLAGMDLVQADRPAGAFAERLGQWIGFADAIALCAVQSAGAALPSRRPGPANSAARTALADEFSRARTAMETSIGLSCTPNGGRTRPELPTPKPGASAQDAAAYEPYRRFHLAQQREMESAIRALRAKVREQVAKASPRLRALVELDATLDQILVEREGRLFAAVPQLLKRRFDELLQAHRQSLLAAGLEDSPGSWLKPGAWLARFCEELKTVLLAELQVRLQPTAGLVEACNNENIRQP